MIFRLKNFGNTFNHLLAEFKAPFAKARKRVETLFSQMVDQFMLCRNYAKQQVGLFARIISKISALTILQYINFINNKPLGQIKHALL